MTTPPPVDVDIRGESPSPLCPTSAGVRGIPSPEAPFVGRCWAASAEPELLDASAERSLLTKLVFTFEGGVAAALTPTSWARGGGVAGGGEAYAAPFRCARSSESCFAIVARSFVSDATVSSRAEAFVRMTPTSAECASRSACNALLRSRASEANCCCDVCTTLLWALLIALASSVRAASLASTSPAHTYSCIRRNCHGASCKSRGANGELQKAHKTLGQISKRLSTMCRSAPPQSLS
jgi:hypothetical protein